MYYTILQEETTLAKAVESLRNYGGGCIYCIDGRIVAYFDNGRVKRFDQSLTMFFL